MSKKDDTIEELLLKKLYPLEMIEDSIIEAQTELNKNFNDYLDDDIAYYKALPFGGNPKHLIIRFDLDIDPDDERSFVFDEIEKAANAEVKLLKKYYPELFGDKRFGYQFIWNEDGLGLYVTLSKENYEKSFKGQNPSYKPRFLSWCESYEQEVQELKELIENHPADAHLLKHEYEQLTGKKYRKSTSQKSMEKKKKPKLTLIKSENPSWVSDEDLWEEAKKKSLKEYGKISYPFVVFIYKRMGGKVKKKTK